MKIFSYLYDKTLIWARHRHAPYYLGVMSFAESIFFPVPTDVMLAPMVLAEREKAWRYALLTCVTSVLGGIVGYLLGYFAFDLWIAPLLQEVGYQAHYEKSVSWFQEYGVWVIFLAGFSPIPYKVFTITAGALQMAFWPFLLGSLVGRAARFYMVAALMYFGGPLMERGLRRWIDVMGWAVILIAVLLYFIYR